MGYSTEGISLQALRTDGLSDNALSSRTPSTDGLSTHGKNIFWALIITPPKEIMGSNPGSATLTTLTDQPGSYSKAIGMASKRLFSSSVYSMYLEWIATSFYLWTPLQLLEAIPADGVPVGAD